LTGAIVNAKRLTKRQLLLIYKKTADCEG